MTDDTKVRAEHKCSQMVRGDFGWHNHQCPRPGSVERDGKFFCKQHDPVAIKAKSDARAAEWQAKFAADRIRRELIARAVRSFEPMRDALEEAEIHLVDLVENFRPTEGVGHPINALRRVRAALALAESPK